MKKRIEIDGGKTRGAEIDFPAYVYTDEFGDITAEMVAEKIANKNGMVQITTRSDGQDRSGDEYVQKYVATIGYHVKSGGYSPESEIRFSYEK